MVGLFVLSVDSLQTENVFAIYVVSIWLISELFILSIIHTPSFTGWKILSLHGCIVTSVQAILGQSMCINVLSFVAFHWLWMHSVLHLEFALHSV